LAGVQGRRRGPRRALTEDEILDAALSLLDEGGANAASLRGIAARVGVAPNAVYTYFPDKAAVIKALVERLLGQVDQSVFADRGQPWRQRVESLALELRARLAAHPGAVHLMISGPLDGPQARVLNERLLELLADAGLDTTDAARAAHLLIVYVFGSIALDVADLRQPGPLPPSQNASPPAPSPSPRRPPTATPVPPPRHPSWPATSPPSNTCGDSTASSTALPPHGQAPEGTTAGQDQGQRHPCGRFSTKRRPGAARSVGSSPR
jgi:AcrR family transcriptional regulator